VPRTLLAVVGGLVMALVALSALAGGEKEKKAPQSTKPTRAQVEEIRKVARQVERVRGLRFRRLPRLQVLTASQAREFALGTLEREYPERSMLADEEVMKLLGLLRRRDAIRRAVSTLFAQEVAGFYDVKSGRMTLVREALAQQEGRDVLLAHELTHALEDQRFGLSEAEGLGADDRLLARSALQEGTATVAMADHALRNLGVPGRRSALLRQLGGMLARQDTALPRYVQSSLVFSYGAGAQFADALVRRGGWRAVNRALRGSGPLSTEQVLHPEAYFRDERPEPPRALGRKALGRRWRRVAAGTLGEFDTGEILRVGTAEPAARRAAAGWAGGRYALWRSAPLGAAGCPAPCRRRDVLVLNWNWDSAAEADEFAGLVPGYLKHGLGGRPAGRGWRLPESAAALARTGRTTALVLAPSPAQGTRVAALALRGS
jgi:predicted nucleic acid-binding protein